MVVSFHMFFSNRNILAKLKKLRTICNDNKNIIKNDNIDNDFSHTGHNIKYFSLTFCLPFSQPSSKQQNMHTPINPKNMKIKYMI